MAVHCSADDIVAEARDWLGTPYLHQASCKGAGADCLGLVRGVWRAVIGPEPETVPSYTPDWSEVSREERLDAGAARHMTRLSGHWGRGDVLLFRMQGAAVAKHVAIVSETGPEGARIIHAYSGHGVVETSLGPAWSRRIVAAFRFPDRST